LTPSHSGLFAVKIRGVRTIVIEALCFTPIRVFSPPATFLNLGAIRASSMETKRTFTQSIHAKAENALLLEILPTKRASITSGLVITRVLPALDASITINVFFSMTVHDGSNLLKQFSGWNVLRSTPIPEDSDGVDNFEQIGIVCGCTRHEFVTKLPKRHVEVFRPNFVIDTVHNAPETRAMLQCLPTQFAWMIIGIISRLRAAVFFFKTVRIVIGADVSHDNHEPLFHGGLVVFNELIEFV